MNCVNVRTSKKTGMAALALTMLAVLILNAGAALPLQAQTETGEQPLTATTQKWTAGFDNFSEPLNYTKSKVKWSVNSTTHKLSVSATLVSATPNKLYQVALMFYCTTFPNTFGQFPVQTTNGGQCESITRQGVTASRAEVEVCVVLTDMNGNGSCSVLVGPDAAGTYNLEFLARDGSGCHINGGSGACNVDFQSPGPTFGDATTITIP
jgi:hypothetical protein